MKLQSPHFEHGGKIHSTFSFEGSGISPALEFIDIPKGTKSLALTMHDIDVPTHVREDGVWDHWIVFDMPPDTIRFIDGQIPPGVQGKTTSGTNAYVPPNPPDKLHRYIFTLYALDSEVYLDENATRKDLDNAMRGHIIESAELVGTYCKKANRVD